MTVDVDATRSYPVLTSDDAAAAATFYREAAAAGTGRNTHTRGATP